jgi:hypothetical protein
MEATTHPGVLGLWDLVILEAKYHDLRQILIYCALDIFNNRFIAIMGIALEGS